MAGHPALAAAGTDPRPAGRAGRRGPGGDGPAGGGTGRARLAGVLALLVIAAAVAVSWAGQQPPAPLPASAPAAQFSAERALQHLRVITGAGPSPVGSEAGDRVRDHLVAELTALGLVLAGTGLAVDRFDGEHPRTTGLLYVPEAGSDTAAWVSTDRTPHDWTARFVPGPADGAPALPLPYGTVPRWTGPAAPAPLPPPTLEILASRLDGETRVVDLRLASRRDADVLTLHADRPVAEVAVTVAGQSPHPSTPGPPADPTARWPYELRFSDPPADGITVTLRLPGRDEPALAVSDHTVGLATVPGFVPRPAGVDRSHAHSSDLLVVGRVHPPAAVG
jgi:hypothetical protein